MKSIFAVLLCIGFLSACTVIPPHNQSTSPSIDQILLHVKVDVWGNEGNPKLPAHSIKEEDVQIATGQTFGPTNYVIRQPPFKLTRIIDRNTITIQFDEGLTIVGQPVSKPYPDNPLTFSNETCFRTRTLDAGTDVCLRIV